MRFLPAALLLAALAFLIPAPEAEGQIRASEPSTFTQAIDGTVFRIDYYRPRTRGRYPLFGKDAVVWEHIWTPGANWATKLSFQKPIELNGRSLEPGIYSLWFELDEDMMPHEFFLEPDTLIFHTMGPPRADDQIRFPVTMEHDAPFRELLTWDFEDIGSTGGVLSMRWGTHRVAFDIKVESSMRVTSTAEEVAMALGTFEAHIQGPGGRTSPTFTITFSHDADGILHADWEGVPAQTGEGLDPFFNPLDMWLLPGNAEGWFVPGESFEPGVLREVWAGSFFEFDLNEDGSSDSFTLRDDIDQVFARGKRIR